MKNKQWFEYIELNICSYFCIRHWTTLNFRTIKIQYHDKVLYFVFIFSFLSVSSVCTLSRVVLLLLNCSLIHICHYWIIMTIVVLYVGCWLLFCIFVDIIIGKMYLCKKWTANILANYTQWNNFKCINIYELNSTANILSSVNVKF